MTDEPATMTNEPRNLSTHLVDKPKIIEAHQISIDQITTTEANARGLKPLVGPRIVTCRYNSPSSSSSDYEHQPLPSGVFKGVSIPDGTVAVVGGQSCDRNIGDLGSMDECLAVIPIVYYGRS